VYTFAKARFQDIGLDYCYATDCDWNRFYIRLSILLRNFVV